MKKKNFGLPKDTNRIFIEKLRILNFKSFKSEQEVKFAPMINLVFGRNSSGKSTINQSIRLFRQSYKQGNLTPMNYESPSELKNNGGLDIDIGYQGIVNEGDIKKSITIGMQTAQFNKKDNIIYKPKSSLLQFSYAYKKNFYTGKNLIGDKTVLKKLRISNLYFDAEIDMKKHKFFKENSKIGKYLKEKIDLKSGEFFFISITKL